MSRATIFVIFFVCLNWYDSRCQLQNQEGYCFARDDQTHVFFNKYTPYELVYYKNKLGELPDGCFPIQLTMISRAGNYYPGAKTINEINDVIPAIKKDLQDGSQIHLCSEDVKLLNSYQFDMDESMAKKLTPQGITDFLEMAKRKKRDFPEIFDQPYSPNLYKFLDDGSRNSKESALALALGLWGSSDIAIQETDVELLQRLKKTCSDFKNSNEVMQQYNDFFNGEIIALTVANINKRLGYCNDEGLSKEQVNTLFKACGFDTARNLTTKSPLCVPFTPQDLQVFDYLQDLLRYYRYVRGKEERHTLAYPIVNDIYNLFNQIISQDGQNVDYPKGIFYFPFWGIRYSIFAVLDLINTNIAINAGNYEHELQREFKSSQLDPYSSNLDVVLYQCKAGEKYRVMIRLQERPIVQLIDGCDGSGLYGWQQFSAFIQNLLTNDHQTQTQTVTQNNAAINF